MTPQLTVSLLISADGKTATRSGESLTSCASPDYLNRLQSHRQAADCLLIDTSLQVFQIQENTAVIALGNSSTWQPTLDSLPSDRVVVINDPKDLTAANLQAIARTLDIHSIHCEPSTHLARELLKEQMVHVLNITILLALTGGHAAETITGNGAASAFINSHQFSLVSHQQTENEIHLNYQRPN